MQLWRSLSLRKACSGFESGLLLHASDDCRFGCWGGIQWRCRPQPSRCPPATATGPDGARTPSPRAQRIRRAVARTRLISCARLLALWPGVVVHGVPMTASGDQSIIIFTGGRNSLPPRWREGSSFSPAVASRTHTHTRAEQPATRHQDLLWKDSTQCIKPYAATNERISYGQDGVCRGPSASG